MRPTMMIANCAPLGYSISAVASPFCSGSVPGAVAVMGGAGALAAASSTFSFSMTELVILDEECAVDIVGVVASLSDDTVVVVIVTGRIGSGEGRCQIRCTVRR